MARKKLQLLPKKKTAEESPKKRGIPKGSTRRNRKEKKMALNKVKRMLMTTHLASGQIIEQIEKELGVGHRQAQNYFNEALEMRVQMSERSLAIDVANHKEVLWKQVVVASNAALLAYQDESMSAADKKMLMDAALAASKAFSAVAGTEWNQRNTIEKSMSMEIDHEQVDTAKRFIKESFKAMITEKTVSDDENIEFE